MEMVDSQPLDAGSDGFGWLLPLWSDLHTLAVEAEQNAYKLPDFSAIRLRSFSEAMVCHLFRHHGLLLNDQEKQFDRLLLLQKNDLLDRRILGILHTIRKLGNGAAHGTRTISIEEASNLIEDAQSLTAWFCPHMRPDIDWQARRPVRSINPPKMSTSMRDMFEDELTLDQQNCVAALDEFLADDSKRIFLLKGYAGTGKTFLASGLAEAMLTNGRRFSLAAPTGRAAKVISERTKLSASTIHSLIYDYSGMAEQPEDEDDQSSTFKIVAKVRNNEDPIDAVTIIDEASLLSNVYSESEFFRSGSGHLLQDLIAYVGAPHSGNARKIIFIGDPAQLPPVGMSTSPALDADYLRETFGLDAASYELTEIVRQKAESAVIRNVMPLREGVVSGSFSSLTFSFDNDVIQLPMDSVRPHYMRIREGRGAQAPIIITYSNNEAANFNRAIRNELFPGQATVAPSDSVIVASNSFCGSHYVANGEILQIASVEPTVERRSVQLLQKSSNSSASQSINVALNFRDVSVALPQPEGNDLILHVKILDDYLHGDDATLDSTHQRALYVDFLMRHKHIDRNKDRSAFQLALRSDPYFNALRLKFGYAITCHKAQGGEWSHVIVSCATRRNPRSSDYFRWLYTAMTRTNGKLYLVDPPEIRLRPAGIGWIKPESAEARQATPDISFSAQNATRSEPQIDSSAPVVSPQALFRSELQTQIRDRLADTGIQIEDIAHHQYREAYFFKRGTEAVRIDIGYKGNWTVSGVTCANPDGFAQEIIARIAGLAGQQLGSASPDLAKANAPSRPFLRNFHARLMAALEMKGIKLVSLKELPWSQRYSLARGSDLVTVDIFYNGKNQLTRFMPINPSRTPSSSLVQMQDDVGTILSVEVHP